MLVDAIMYNKTECVKYLIKDQNVNTSVLDDTDVYNSFKKIESLICDQEENNLKPDIAISLNNVKITDNNLEQVEKDLEYKKLSGWFNKHINIKYNQVTEIGNFEGGKLFGYLPADYDEKLWHNALDRGFASQSKDSNGVKYREHKLLELKNCNSNERLYTKTVHKNTQGDYLAIFDHETNHKGIEREVRDTKKILIDDSCASDFYLADHSDTHDSTDTAMLAVEADDGLSDYHF